MLLSRMLIISVLLAVVCTWVCSGVALAQQLNWNKGTGDWNDPNNWNGDADPNVHAVPTFSDIAIIGPTVSTPLGTGPAIVNTAGAQALRVEVQDGGELFLTTGGDLTTIDELFMRTGAGTVTVEGGAQLSVSNLVTGRDSASGTLNISGAGTTVTNNANEFWFGIGSGATGTLNMSGGTVNTAGMATMFVGPFGGTGIVNQSGGTINVGNWMFVGAQRGGAAGGSGDYQMSGGSLTAGGIIIISEQGGDTGTFRIGTDATVSSTGGNFEVAQGGTGVLHVDGSGSDLPLTHAAGAVGVSLVSTLNPDGRVRWSIDSGGARTLTPPAFWLHNSDPNTPRAFLEADLKGGAALTASNTFTLLQADPNDPEGFRNVAGEGSQKGLVDTALFDLIEDDANDRATATLQASADQGNATVDGGPVAITATAVGYVDVARGGFAGSEVEVEMTFASGEDEADLASWMNGEFNWGFAANTVVATGNDGADTILLTGLPMDPGPTSFFSWDFGAFNTDNATNFQVTSVEASEIGAIINGDFDGTGFVDGLDFLKWQRGESPNPLSPADLALWQSQYGGPPPLTSALATVPEPSSLLMWSLAGGWLLRFRRRWVS